MTSARNKFIFSGRNVARVSLLAVVLTILLVWVLGFRSHRSLFNNALLSATIISAALFLFLFIGLYKGFSLHNDLSWHSRRNSTSSGGSGWTPDLSWNLDAEGCLIAIGLWLVITLLAYLFNFFLPASLEGLGLIGLFYWLFYRALNVVFTRSAQCQGNWRNSLGYALLFTTLYCGWVYGVIYLLNRL
jgi:hypothetical protein